MTRFGLPPRLTDWSLLAAVAVLLATGLVGLVTGRPGGWWVFAAHGVTGLALAVLVGWKLRRVRGRLAAGRWDRRVAASALLATLTLAALATGVYWVSGGSFRVLAWNGLVVHMVLGVAVALLLVVHLTYRWRPPARTDLDRRAAVTYAGLVVAAAVAWAGQRTVNRLLGLVAPRRFTGSREADSLSGNAFPTTSWVADDPDPVAPDAWSLRVGGRVASPFEATYGELVPGEGAETEAGGSDQTGTGTGTRVLLDCTSGWYSVQDWRGVRVGDLLDRADPDGDAEWVRFTSVTGYRWSLPLGEAREALLATHVGGDPISHGHGFPLRLVAPGRRGFQWVKWVESVEVRARPDPGQWVAVFVSGFVDDRPERRG